MDVELVSQAFDEKNFSEKVFEKALSKLVSKELAAALRVQSVVLDAACGFMRRKGLIQLLPIIISPVTDPLSHSVSDGSVDCGGRKLQLTKSMILHKQLALASVGKGAGVFVVSPNVRLEPKEKAGTGRHLLEFSQFDFEIKGAEMRGAMDFIEDLFASVFSRVERECWKDLAFFSRDLRVPEKPFPVFDSVELRSRFGARWEDEASRSSKKFFWVVNHEREFYDREDPEKSGHFLNYDVFYPDGFGEALSGGEREFEYERIIERMKRNGTRPEEFTPYLAAARRGMLSSSAGAGFGIERMVRFICGAKHVADVSPFAKIPGQEQEIVF
ncbi:MAG: asparagine synthetase A [Candidatus Micrarchaeota archaeon]